MKPASEWEKETVWSLLTEWENDNPVTLAILTRKRLKLIRAIQNDARRKEKKK